MILDKTFLYRFEWNKWHLPNKKMVEKLQIKTKILEMQQE